MELFQARGPFGICIIGRILERNDMAFAILHQWQPEVFSDVDKLQSVDNLSDLVFMRLDILHKYALISQQ